MKPELPSIGASFGILDVVKGRRALKTYVQRNGSLPAVIRATITEPGSEDAVSTEFTLHVTSVSLDSAYQTILAPAVKHQNVVWALPAPAAHDDVVAFIKKKLGLPPGILPELPEFGFICSDGRFLDRYDAYRVAEAAGQLMPMDRVNEGRRALKQLYTDDLWVWRSR